MRHSLEPSGQEGEDGGMKHDWPHCGPPSGTQVVLEHWGLGWEEPRAGRDLMNMTAHLKAPPYSCADKPPLAVFWPLLATLGKKKQGGKRTAYLDYWSERQGGNCQCPYQWHGRQELPQSALGKSHSLSES